MRLRGGEGRWTSYRAAGELDSHNVRNLPGACAHALLIASAAIAGMSAKHRSLPPRALTGAIDRDCAPLPRTRQHRRPPDMQASLRCAAGVRWPHARCRGAARDACAAYLGRRRSLTAGRALSDRQGHNEAQAAIFNAPEVVSAFQEPLPGDVQQVRGRSIRGHQLAFSCAELDTGACAKL